MALIARLPTVAEMEEICSTALANMNIRVRSILETDCHEAVPLIGGSWFETVKRFSDAGSRETLQKAVEQCEEDIETIMVTVMVWMASAPLSADTTGHQPMFS